MLIAQALGEYGVFGTLVDSVTSVQGVLTERFREVSPATWVVAVIALALIWMMFIRR